MSSQQINQQTSQQTSQRPTLAQITAALAAVRDEARAGDRAQYASAMTSARAVGCIDDQIEDAHRWGVRQRMTLDTHLPGGVDSTSTATSPRPPAHLWPAPQV